MFLTAGVFLFNLLCALVPCDMPRSAPEFLSEPRSTSMRIHNFKLKLKLPIVHTPNGALEGYFMTAMNGRLIMAFEGIPYGEAKRWRLATPARPWRGVHQAKRPGPFCLQINPVQALRVVGSENCLFLNVHTPKIPDSLNENKRYPVIVFIHGGSFLCGAGSDYGPTYLLSEEVILVTFNYRLGVLGFISADGVPANIGLKDQALALKWIHENIEHFGGNKHNISLWGQSSGAACVGLHLISEKIRNYFSTAFAMSGSSFNWWTVQSQATVRRHTRKLAGFFGCERKPSLELMRCLESVNVDLLVITQLSIYDWLPFPVVTFSPTVEPKHPDSFLTETPADAYRNGLVARKPIVYGMTKDEGKGLLLGIVVIPRMFSLRAMWRQIAPIFLELKGQVWNEDEVVDKVEEFYFKGKNVWQVGIDSFADMMSDRYINSGVVQGVQAHSSSGSPTYMYMFSYTEGNHSLADNIGLKSREWGAGHGEDLAYFFNMSSFVDAHKQSDPDHELSSIMINLLVNFAATGKPVYRNKNGGHLEVWDRTDRNLTRLNVLQLDRNIKMIPLPQRMVDGLKFWNDLKLPKMNLWSPFH